MTRRITTVSNDEDPDEVPKYGNLDCALTPSLPKITTKQPVYNSPCNFFPCHHYHYSFSVQSWTRTTQGGIFVFSAALYKPCGVITFIIFITATIYFSLLYKTMTKNDNAAVS